VSGVRLSWRHHSTTGGGR